MWKKKGTGKKKEQGERVKRKKNALANAKMKSGHCRINCRITRYEHRGFTGVRVMRNES